MRFIVEQRQLTDVTGKPIAAPNKVSFHAFDAQDVDEAIRLIIKKESGELIGNVLKFPGFHAVATLRNPAGVYTLQVGPASQAG